MKNKIENNTSLKNIQSCTRREHFLVYHHKVHIEIS